MPFAVSTWADVLQERITARLVAVIPAERVLESLAEDADHLQFPPADQFLTVRPVSFPVSVPGVSGAGRILTGFDATWRVSVFHRFAADQELRDSRKLRDATRGVLGLVKKVISALQMYSPATVAAPTDYLVREPMRLRSWDLQPRSIKGQGGWTVTPTLWQVQFVTELTP